MITSLPAARFVDPKGTKLLFIKYQKKDISPFGLLSPFDERAVHFFQLEKGQVPGFACKVFVLLKTSLWVLPRQDASTTRGTKSPRKRNISNVQRSCVPSACDRGKRGVASKKSAREDPPFFPTAAVAESPRNKQKEGGVGGGKKRTETS